MGYTPKYSKFGQELEFHGVELSGPAKRLQAAGKMGTWKQNIARDMMRQVGKVVPWQHYGIKFNLWFAYAAAAIDH